MKKKIVPVGFFVLIVVLGALILFVTNKHSGTSAIVQAAFSRSEVFLFAQDYNVRLKLTSFLELIQLEQFG